MADRRPSRIPLRTALLMIGSYAKTRIVEQLRSVAFITIYLVAFQTLILRTPPADAVQIAGGIAMVVVGLAFFLEGLLIGIMPLGEQVGVLLPKHTGITVIAVFGVVVGVGSTLAEPAIAALRAAGGQVTPWEAPVLYELIEQRPDTLIWSIGAGVGVAVAIGMIRFFYGLSIKLFVYTIIPLLILTTIVFSFHSKLTTIIGLAWDSGAVTTGPVTVPLVIALGIGVTRAAGRSEGASGSFGVIMLASALPVLSVLWLSAFVAGSVSGPMEEELFFSPEYRSEAVETIGSESELETLAFERGSERARRAFYSDPDSYDEAISAFADNEHVRDEILASMSLGEWLDLQASSTERDIVPRSVRQQALSASSLRSPASVFASESLGAVRAVLPLAAVLLLALVLFLRERPRQTDELLLGTVLALVGMTLLTTGIRFGLEPLGDEVGRQLPRAFRSEPEAAERITVSRFSEELLIEGITADGDREVFFLFAEDGEFRRIPFEPERYDEERGVYEIVVEASPLFSRELTFVGIGLVLLFAFGLGYGATLAEPALNALGRTVEHLSVGTIPRRAIIAAVAIGVGSGITVGIVRILYDLPTAWLIIPPYLIALILTAFNDDDFAAIAWDSGGVTTGPVTVPLVMAVGLGIGAELNVIEGFGVLSVASVMPILSVLVYGLSIRTRQQRVIGGDVEEDDHA
ncbi:MAG: DUF1538 domain-containing protein [Spirochaetales bacterium]